MPTRASTSKKLSPSPTRLRNQQLPRRRKQQHTSTSSAPLQQRQDSHSKNQQQQQMVSSSKSVAAAPPLPPHPVSLKEPFQSRNPAPEGKSTGGLKLDLNLDVEVQVNARVHGDLTLAIF
ncbi:hypothetical protein BDB00DRAFT_788340 [Zychaea mexicana]|uniref:uncharacterized protein n=1 Tax=Zychaea mexicana TaxID=64656 RepID=UPI0022FE1031|nr:uncharacterized protein BDB00DRAFT_788340 [Zychaea mexicana]KAI9492996.1 hypothetical protein BDB00DRAFT_788340 [Zychaea mexicana]